MKKIKAFSLIEALLVIAIISVLISLGLSFANKYAQKVKVRRTSFELQHILEAGVQYYMATNLWPDFSNFSKFQPYLSLSSLQNPWGYPYTYGKSSAVKFSVTTKLPSSMIESQIESLMANAYHVSSDSRSIIAEIPVHFSVPPPTSFVNYIGSYAVDNRTFSGSATISLNSPPCPPGFNRNIFPIIRNMEFGSLLKSTGGFFTHLIQVQPLPLSGDSVEVAFQALICKVNPGINNNCDQADYDYAPLTGGNSVMQRDGHFGFYYISYCVKQ